MKHLFVILFIGLLSSCKEQTLSNNLTHNVEVDNLSARLEELTEKYKPALGEIMAGIQMHHSKLWFAGINSNWKLSEYEIKELKERIEQAKEIETNRPEIKDIPIIYSALDSISFAIKQKNMSLFKSNFQLLTNSCNTCHKAVNFEFNVIIIPTALPVTNQDFKVH